MPNTIDTFYYKGRVLARGTHSDPCVVSATWYAVFRDSEYGTLVYQPADQRPSEA